MADIKLGDRVKIHGKDANGKVAFIGETHFSGGTWFGIILDEAKGKHNGTIDGNCYFKCPKNHGVFVRVCQIVKESVDNSVESKPNNILTSKSRYPNYLKASSKLKSDKRKNEQERNDISKTSSQVNQQTAEIRPSQNISENSELREVIKNGCSKKLKSGEESVSPLKYMKAMEEIKHLKNELDCKKKQVQTQKGHLKLLKMRLCNHYTKVQPYNVAKKGSNQSTIYNCLAGQYNSTDNEGNCSDEEFDSKNMISMQRVIELEEQNKKLIHGLTELREFIKRNCRSQLMDFEIPKARIRQRLKNETKNSGFLPGCTSASIAVQNNNGSVNVGSTSELKHMLQEMRKFTKIVNEKNKLRRGSKSQNLVRPEQKGDSNTVRREPKTDYNKIFDLGNQQPYNFCTEIQKVRIQQRLKSKKKNSSFFPGCTSSSIAVQNDNGSVNIGSTSDLKAMLQEMRNFSDIVNEKNKLRRRSKSQNLIRPEQAEDSNSVRRELKTEYNKIFDLGNQQPYNLVPIFHNSKTSFDVSGIQKESKALQYSWKMTNVNQNAIYPFKNMPEANRNSLFHCIGNRLSSKSADELKQLPSSLVTNSEDPSFASLIQQDLRVDIPNSASSSSRREFKSRPETSLSLRNSAKEVAVKTCGDGALVVPKVKRSYR